MWPCPCRSPDHWTRHRSRWRPFPPASAVVPASCSPFAEPHLYARHVLPRPPEEERRITRPHRMILRGQRRAKQRHDAIAHDLIHGALVAVHGLHHAFQHGVENRARLLGVAVGEQLHRALEVAKQHGHLLTLPFEGGARVEDLLSQMGRYEGLKPWRGPGERGGVRGWRGLREARPALAAEREARWILEVTVRAAWAEFG